MMVSCFAVKRTVLMISTQCSEFRFKRVVRVIESVLSLRGYDDDA